MNTQQFITASFNKLLSHAAKERIERVTLTIAIFSYLIHLLLIFLNVRGIIVLDDTFFTNPIAAIYTPFSFILLYEVYLLLYFLPKSITVYIGKQYEIITLIVIRRIFKDIAYVELTSDWFQDKDDLQFTFDVLTSLILFFLIFLFYRNVKKTGYKSINKTTETGMNIRRFVLLKRALATVLVPILFLLAVYTLVHWGLATISDYGDGVLEFKKINNVFFDEFFSVLIIVDVLLLLFSFFYSDKFHKIIRNSGFVISTILIKVSFLSTGIVNNLLIIGAVLFGYLVLLIHDLYEKDAASNAVLNEATVEEGDY
ncbi:hypothetical protein [Neolewinella antarctica]|uniref:Glycerophosphoryl diester phosphodiesterase membrane domain-containing protein n=1 Tax=Neolewinella antarctica TaxID=442734 RepID=A0ABX0XEW2_9BACT|nr:hypothetical protein [Neolewinella antarctica]NJC27418.1 hypothetical protein [Neolewinella antarctica]